MGLTNALVGPIFHKSSCALPPNAKFSYKSVQANELSSANRQTPLCIENDFYYIC